MIADTVDPIAYFLTTFFFDDLIIALPIDLAICQMSKKCAHPGTQALST